jgi:hypothetical protein
LRLERSLAVMRCVRIVDRPNETYRFAAVDQATGEVPLQLADRAALVALCERLGWTIQDDSQPVGLTAQIGFVAARPRGSAGFDPPNQ